MRDSKQNIVHVLSTVFLIVSLVFAGGISVSALTPQDAEASFEIDQQVNTNSDTCYDGNTLPPVYCGGFDANCLCEIVITPQEK